MPKITANFDDVPDSYPVVKPGIYDAQLSKVELTDQDTHDGATIRCIDIGQVKITGAIAADNEACVNMNLPGKTRLWLSDQYESNWIKLKRLVLSAGLNPADDIDTEELEGATVRIKVRHRHDKDAGITRVEVGDFIPPAEQ